MSLATAFRIAALKAKARRAYITVHDRSAAMSCGAHLASFISPAISQAERDFREAMTELAKIDPEAKALIEKEGLTI